MTTPTTPPSKAKTWISLAGGLLTVILPLALQLAQHLPPEWAGLIGGVIALMTILGIYHAPYVPPGTVIVPAPPVIPPTPTPPPLTPPPSPAPQPCPEPCPDPERRSYVEDAAVRCAGLL